MIGGQWTVDSGLFDDSALKMILDLCKAVPNVKPEFLEGSEQSLIILSFPEQDPAQNKSETGCRACDQRDKINRIVSAELDRKGAILDFIAEWLERRAARAAQTTGLSQMKKPQEVTAS